MYDEKTNNKSFLEMSKFLKMSGIKNSMFMLELKNETLLGVDPHAYDLSYVQKGAIRRECKNNLWYFLREVARIPNIMGGLTLVNLNPGLMASMYLLENGKNIYDIRCRMTYKTIGIALYLLWKRGLKVKIIKNRTPDVQLILDKIVELKSHIPSYIFDDDIPGLAINSMNKNIEWYDDAEFLGKTSLDTLKNGIEDESKQFIITTTINNNPKNDIMKELRKKCTDFYLMMYDTPCTVSKSLPKWIKLEFNADMVGKTEGWKQEIFKELNKNQEAYDTEVMLIRREEKNDSSK